MAFSEPNLTHLGSPESPAPQACSRAPAAGCDEDIAQSDGEPHHARRETKSPRDFTGISLTKSCKIHKCYALLGGS